MARPKKAPAVATGVDLVKLAAELEPEREVYQKRLAWLNAAPLATQDQRDLFGRLLVEIRAAKDADEAKRTAITGPINAGLRELNALFKPRRDIFEAMDRTIVSRLSAATQEARAASSEALAKVGTGDMSPSTLAVAHAVPAPLEGLREVEEYEIEEVDPALVPRPFLKLDMSLAQAFVKRCVKEGMPVPEIAGLKITKKTALRRLPGAA